ncbi:MAG: ion transporter [Hyphomonadaceae bacterium]
MGEHRKGLNRTLFWLYSGNGGWPSVFRWSMLVFDLVTIAVFLVHPLVSWHQTETPQPALWVAADISIAVVIALDFFARLYIERHKWRFFVRPTNWADLIVLVTLVTPVLSQNFSFLRVFRIVRLVRAFEFLDQKTMVGRWLNINSFVVAKVVNLAVFVFLVTALVYVSQVRHNPDITSYLDALYFTIGTLTTVGLGDITLPDTLGRWITIGVMVLGVTLFLQLIRAIAVGDKVRHHCPACHLPLHDRDAAHCKRCGANLFTVAAESRGDA